MLRKISLMPNYFFTSLPLICMTCTWPDQSHFPIYISLPSLYESSKSQSPKETISSYYQKFTNPIVSHLIVYSIYKNHLFPIFQDIETTLFETSPQTQHISSLAPYTSTQQSCLPIRGFLARWTSCHACGKIRTLKTWSCVRGRRVFCCACLSSNLSPGGGILEFFLV